MQVASQAITTASATDAVALLVADVDHFQRIVDVHGEDAGRQVLDTIFELVRRNLRQRDAVARPGGDELLILLRNAPGEALLLANRLCATVRGHIFDIAGMGDVRVTISVGVASAPEHGTTYPSLHAAADRARIRLKAQGRDGAAVAPLAHHETLHRPLDIERFAGRKDELRTLRAWLDDAVRGRPRAVATLGEAGTGTALLLKQLEPEIRFRGGAFAEGRAVRGPMRAAYGVWTAALESLRRLPNAPERPWRELPKLLPSLGGRSVEDDGRAGSKYLLHEELLEHLRLSAEQQPIVLVLEEMQWADEESWDALDYVIQQLDDERLLLCLSMRTEPAFSEAAERRRALATSEIFHELPLSRLTRDDVKRWLEAAFHHQDIGREFLAFLYRHSEGNPLLITELLRTLVEEGALWHNGERWEWSPVSELRLPTTLDALITRRLNRFPTSTLAVLGTAAIIGHEFDVGLVVAAGAGSDRAVHLALSEALAAGIIRRTFERAGGRFAFSHALIAEALVDMVPADQLRQLHGRIAAALERNASDRVAEIASHYDQAESQGAAYVWALRAAASAERLNAHSSAGEFLQTAARNATTPGELAEVRVRLANLAEAAGRYDEVEELCDLAIEWLDAQGEKRRAIMLRRMRERARRELGQPARVTLDALLALDEESKALGFESERISIMMMLSQTYGRLGEPAAEEEIAQECVRMAEALGDQTLLAEAVQRLARAVQSNPSPQNRVERARMLHRRALELFRATGDIRGQASALNNLGIVAGQESRWDEAREVLTHSIALSRSVGAPELWASADANLGLMNQMTGDYDRARELFGEALALFAAIKNTHGQLVSLYNLANVERESGGLSAAAELYEATMSLAKRIGSNEIEIGAAAAAGLCYLELERIETARAFAADVEAAMRTRTGWFQGREHVEALRVRLALFDGDVAGAVGAFKRAMPLADESDLYTAAWLTAVCAPSLFVFEPILVKEWIRRYADRVESLGYTQMSKRYLDLLAR